MADVVLKINLLDINISETSEKFLKAKPNNETKLKDGATPDDNGNYSSDDYEPAFATTKLWVEEVLTDYLWRIIKKGHKIQEREADASVGNRDDFITSG